MVLIDMEMPKRCGDCPFYGLESAGNGMYYDFCEGGKFILCDPDNKVDESCPMKPFTPPKPQVTTNIYDTEEIHHNCTVQVLRNSVTGDVSVGWWEEKEDEE